MTALYQHIEDLSPGDWAALARRAAQTAIAAAEGLGLKPPAEVATVAAMTEQELIAHRNRSGPGQRRLSPVMRLVQADQLRATAEHLAMTAQQDQADAHAEAAMARDEAARTVQETAAARERVREIEIESASKDQKRAADHAADQRIIEELRGEVAQTRADAEAEIAAAREEVRAAEARATQRAAERTQDREDAEKTIQQLRDQIEKVTSDTATRLAAAAEQVHAADTRAAQRTAERTVERETAEHAAQEARSERERVRADSAAAVAEGKGKASGEIADARAAAAVDVARAREEAEAAVTEAQMRASEAVAAAEAEIADARGAADADMARAREEAEAAVAEAQTRASSAIAAAEADIAHVRQESEEAVAQAWERAESDVARIRAVADDEVVRAHQTAQEAIEWAKSEVQRAGSGSADAIAPIQFAGTTGNIAPPSLTIPAPPEEIRADTGPIEDTLAVICQVDELCWRLLQNSGPDGVRYPVSIEHAQSLIRAVQQQAGDISQQLYSLTSQHRDPRRSEVANQYARDAADAYSGFLQRIAAAADRLGQLEQSRDADVVAVIIQMLDEHPWVSR